MFKKKTLSKNTRTHTHSYIHTYIYIYIYIYIYLLINYLPVFTVPEKNKKPLARNKRKKYLESRSRGKRKSFLGKKERKDQPRPTP